MQYEKTIQTAFAEVSNALIAHQRTRESRVEQEKLVTALKTASASPTYAIGAEWIRNSTPSMPIATSFRPN